MDRLTVAENDHLTNENLSLRKQLNSYTSKHNFDMYEDLLAALTISEIQRERIRFLQTELEYVENRKAKLIEEENKTKNIRALESQGNLELRLEAARQKRTQLEMELENLDRKVRRELTEAKISSAKQSGNILSNL